MRSRSLKRQKQERQYGTEKLNHLTENPICCARVVCQGNIATQIHHKKGRIGELLCNREYFLAVCWACHEYIENNPTISKEKGFSLSRLDK